MNLNQLYITEDIGCNFHGGLNIILGVNRFSTEAIKKEFNGNSEQLLAQNVDTVSVKLNKEENTEESLMDKNGLPNESKNVSDTNGVGKTLLVSVVKHVLGGDIETALSSSFFTDKKYWGTLEISYGEKLVVISRPLWSPLGDDLYLVLDDSLQKYHDLMTKAHINLEEIISARELSEQLERVNSPIRSMNKKTFQQYIAKLENIDYSKSNITLSSLLDFLIRDEKVGYTDPIARIRRSQWVQYRSAQYLFGLPANTEETCSKLQEQIADLQINLKAILARLKAREITGDDKIENLKLFANIRLQKIREEIEEVKVLPALEQVRKDYQETKEQFTKMTADLNKKERYLSGYMKNRQNLQLKSKAMTELLKVKDFYDELIQFFPEQLEKNLNEFNSFFDNLSDDRERYYSELITEIRADIKYLKAEKERLEPLLTSLSQQFKNTSLIKDISILTAREDKIQNEIKELEDLRKVLLERDGLEEKINELENFRRDALKEGKIQEKKFQDRRRSLINLFHELVSEIYGVDDGELAFEYNSNESSTTAGRTEIICHIPSQSSHGRTYAKINIFDFIWLLGEKGEDDFNPGFLIHDGSYSKISKEVKKKMLEAIITRLGQKQYFITINEGELEIPTDWEEYVCCKLDGSKIEGKFFKQQFD